MAVLGAAACAGGRADRSRDGPDAGASGWFDAGGGAESEAESEAEAEAEGCTEMIVCGGLAGTAGLDSGGRYTPAADCPPVCGDGTCNPGESECNCPSDCDEPGSGC